jgi:dihydrofolate reductase
MRIAVIVAMSQNNVIGKDNKLPWHMPADLAHFKKITLGKPIIMGRKTYESIGRPLPGRLNIIISRDKNYKAEGCVVTHSLDEALKATGVVDEVFIIGGALLFAEVLPQVERIYLTRIHHDFDGDAFFPALNLLEWRESESEAFPPDEKNAYSYTFSTLDRL